ncbi:hypothetical protein Tco_0390533 [Tanacetum coccineum]
MGRSGIRIRGMLLQDQQHKILSRGSGEDCYGESSVMTHQSRSALSPPQIGGLSVVVGNNYRGRAGAGVLSLLLIPPAFNVKSSSSSFLRWVSHRLPHVIPPPLAQIFSSLYALGLEYNTSKGGLHALAPLGPGRKSGEGWGLKSGHPCMGPLDPKRFKVLRVGKISHYSSW